MSLGAVRIDVPVNKILRKGGITNYTFGLKTSTSQKSSALYFDNFVVQELENGEQLEYIIRYEPEENWFYKKNRDLAIYSGRIKIYNLQAELVGNMEIENGQLVPAQQQKLNDELECMLVLDYIFCIGDVNGGEGYSCSYHYNTECSSPSSGGGGYIPEETPYETPTGGNWGNDPTGGGDTNNGDPDIDTRPILPDDEDIDTIEDKINSDSLTGKAKCLNDLLDKQGASFVQELLENFRGESEFDIQIESKDDLYGPDGKLVNGLTFEPSNNIINIQISTNAAASRPALSVVRTILHEYIHADMYRKLRTEDQAHTNDVLNFKDTYEKFENGNFQNGAQHETMAELYIDEMTKSLKEIHKNAFMGDYNYLTNNGASPLPDNFYEALAWNGLTEEGKVVEAYNQLSDDKKAALQESLNFYYPSITTNCPETD